MVLYEVRQYEMCFIIHRQGPDLRYLRRATRFLTRMGQSQNVDIVPLCAQRQLYRQTDTLQHPQILILSHGECPILVKSVYYKEWEGFFGFRDIDSDFGPSYEKC